MATAAPAPARTTTTPATATIHAGDNLPILRGFPAASFDLVYIDPPFNTGKTQTRSRIRVTRDDVDGDRVGFGGRRYRTARLGSRSFDDAFGDFLMFLEPRLVEAHRLLGTEGRRIGHARQVEPDRVTRGHQATQISVQPRIMRLFDREPERILLCHHLFRHTQRRQQEEQRSYGHEHSCSSSTIWLYTAAGSFARVIGRPTTKWVAPASAAALACPDGGDRHAGEHRGR